MASFIFTLSFLAHAGPVDNFVCEKSSKVTSGKNVGFKLINCKSINGDLSSLNIIKRNNATFFVLGSDEIECGTPRTITKLSECKDKKVQVGASNLIFTTPNFDKKSSFSLLSL